MQPKHFKKPLISILNVELELKAEKENAEIRVENVEVSNVSNDGFRNGDAEEYLIKYYKRPCRFCFCVLERCELISLSCLVISGIPEDS